MSTQASALIVKVQELAGTSLNRPEREIAKAFEAGVEAVVAGDVPVRADVLRLLCVNAHLADSGQVAGLRVRSAYVPEALDLSGLRLDFPLWLQGCALAALRLADARLLSLNLGGSTCAGIHADRVSVTHGMLLNSGFKAEGMVWLPDASIGGDLNCGGGSFASAAGEKWALLFDGARIGGRVFLRAARVQAEHKRATRFVAEGRVSGMSARIDGSLLCTGARFHSPVTFNAAIVGGRCRFTGACAASIEMPRATFQGPLSFRDAVIGGDLDLHRVSVGGNLTMRGAKIGGHLRLSGVTVTGNLNFSAATLDASTQIALTGTNVTGSLTWREVSYASSRGTHCVETAAVGGVDLAQATVGFLDDDSQSWPPSGTVTLEGFTYRAVAVDPPVTVPWYRKLGRHAGSDAWLDRRVRWLSRQPKPRWSPQPYEQLSAALKAAGYEAAARKVSIERERARRARGGLGIFSRLFSVLLGVTLGHGYRPLYAFGWAALVISVGVVVFGGLSFIAKENAPPYSAVGYSLDAFLPIVNLHQEEARAPATTPGNVYLWVHIALGWLLTTLGIAGVTGLVRKD